MCGKGKRKGRGGRREEGRERKERKRLLANVTHLSDSEVTGTGLLRSRKGLSEKVFIPGFQRVTLATNLYEGFEQSCVPAPPAHIPFPGKSLAVLSGGATCCKLFLHHHLFLCSLEASCCLPEYPCCPVPPPKNSWPNSSGASGGECLESGLGP